ncbi:MAG: SRPBCC domain-containing protein [Phycisphaerales bacterium]|nr:SRPBCC domain-containing protein [Phycisphaerales bacterium]
MAYTGPQTTELTLTRTIPASPEEVYDAWLDPSTPGGPWAGPSPSRVILQAARVDGLFYISVDHDHHEWAHYGRFTVLDRPHRIAHTWVSEATRGLESVVTMTFEPKGDMTLVTLHHAGVPDDQLGRQHREGWGGLLDAFGGHFARGSS